MRNLILAAIMLGSVCLSACSKDPGEPQREPGSFLRPGGDVVYGGTK